MALRRSEGFRRIALSIQYNGSSFLGFARQREEEVDTTHPTRTRSVEGCLRDALGSFVGNDNFEHLQVSSRTDRGVHAIKNTLHVDIRPRYYKDESRLANEIDPTEVKKALNFHLKGITCYVRVLNSIKAPDTMLNRFHNENPMDEPPFVNWNARFSVTSRTYLYKIIRISSYSNQAGFVFDFDRSWRLRRRQSLDIPAMKQAAKHLVGSKKDFSSFRRAHCQRSSPILNMMDVQVESRPYGEEHYAFIGGGDDSTTNGMHSEAEIVHIKFVSDAFLYGQVRNMVGVLVDVGMGRIHPDRIPAIIEERDRTAVDSASAPARGLFLLDVRHGDDFVI